MKIFAIISSIFAGATGIQVSTKKPEIYTEELAVKAEASIQVQFDSPETEFESPEPWKIAWCCAQWQGCMDNICMEPLQNLAHWVQN